MGRQPSRKNHHYKTIPFPDDVWEVMTRYRHKVEAKSEVDACLRLFMAGMDVECPGWRSRKPKKEEAA